MPTGGASFDVDSSGNVYLLDEANSRMLEFTGAGAPRRSPLPGLAGVRADLRVSDASGTAYVLESWRTRRCPGRCSGRTRCRASL